jgi:predicted AAA+ superfamily ATPase
MKIKISSILQSDCILDGDAMADLARDADVAPNTAKSWLSILQGSGVVFLLQPWHSNITKRMLKTPKLYFLDTGLCTYLTDRFHSILVAAL